MPHKETKEKTVKSNEEIISEANNMISEGADVDVVAEWLAGSLDPSVEL